MSGPTWAGVFAVLVALLAPPAAAQEFAISSPAFPDPGEVRCPGGITSGPDGAIWFTEEMTGRIGRMTTAGVVTGEFQVAAPNSGSVPCSDPSFVGALDQITTGPDGNLWFTQPRDNTIGWITTAGVPGSLPPLPLPDSRPEGITVGPDGNVWFTAANGLRIGRVTLGGPNHGTITLFGPTGSGPSDIAAGADGRLWFTESLANRIGAIATNAAAAPATAISYFSTGLTGGSDPSGITAGPGGGLWFTESAANQIGQISTGGAITEYPGAGAGPSAIAVGRDGALWFTESEASSIGRITTAGLITNHFPTPTPGSEPSDITAGPDGAVWFSENAGNRIGRIDTAPPVAAAPTLPTFKPLLPKRKRCKVPKLKGLTVKKATKKLRKAKCRYRFTGKGRVVSSKPKAGKRTAKTVRVKAKRKPARQRRGQRGARP
jgi:virginiamycin B lyase